MYFKGFRALSVFILLGIIAVNQSCSKDELITAPGVVVNNGSFASGGCEWIIIIGPQQFKPDNLPVQCEQVDSVEVTYRLVRSTVDCPPTQNYSGVIHLHRIRSLINGSPCI